MLDTWLIILFIIIGIVVLFAVGFLIWRFLLRPKKEEPDRFMTVTCETCSNQLKIDKYDPPTKIVCTNCGKEGPVKFP